MSLSAWLSWLLFAVPATAERVLDALLAAELDVPDSLPCVTYWTAAHGFAPDRVTHELLERWGSSSSSSGFSRVRPS